MSDKFKESLDFVTKFYQPGAFKARRILDHDVALPWWRRNIVAASIVAAVLVASAAIFVYRSSRTPQSHPDLPAAENEMPVKTNADTPLLIEFNDAPLHEVVAEIETAYNVKVTGVPADTDARLSLHYEGTAADLVETINELLGTDMKTEPQSSNDL